MNSEAKAEKPLRFGTIEKRLGLEPGEITNEWSKMEGFPAAGEGVAVLSEVESWANDRYDSETATIADRVSSGVEAALLAEIDDADVAVFETLLGGAGGGDPVEPVVAVADEGPIVGYVTLRIPVVKDSGAKLPARINQGYSLRSGDVHIRKAFGDLLKGCNGTSVKLADGSHVDNWSGMYRYLGELISTAEVEYANT